MPDNQNIRLAKNSILLYVRLGITTICSLFTTRYALLALGVDDFGLFSLLGSIISFIGILNTIMLSTSNRFIAVAIGKNDEIEISKTFNVNFTVHLLIAIFTALLALPIGEWYIHSFLNYSGEIRNAEVVFLFTALGSIFSFIGVPYNGLLMAKEKFSVFCLADIAMYVCRLVVAVILLKIGAEYRLFVYSIMTSLFIASPTIVYINYCGRHYKQIVKLSVVKDKRAYKDVFSFSGWVAFGAVAVVAKGQGAALLINNYFSTAMNSALGVAHSVSTMVEMFAQNISKPMAPQIIKSYAAGEMDRTNRLLQMSTKFSFLLMLMVSVPFFVNCDWILQIWLTEIPSYTSLFIKLLVVDSLVSSLSTGFSNVIFANGNIKSYQIVVNIIRLLALVVAYICLKNGCPPQSLFLCYIAFNLLSFIVSQSIIYNIVRFDLRSLIRCSYVPCIIISILITPFFIIPYHVHPIVQYCLCEMVLFAFIFLIGLSQHERNIIVNYIKNRIWRAV